MKKDISKKKVIKSSIDEVWKAISNQELLSKWFFESTLEQKETGKVVFKDNNDKYFSGEVLTIQEPINLAYSWNDPNLNHTTYVWWKLMEQDEKTIVELEHSGFKGVRGEIRGFSYGSFWTKALKNLDNFLQQEIVPE